MPTVTITPLDLANSEKVQEFLRSHPLPLPPTYISCTRSGRLYLANGPSLHSLHDPYTNEHITTHPEMPQTWAGPKEKFLSLLHSVYYNGDELVTQDGAPAVLKPCTTRTAWNTAVLEVTFG
jgi:hypothetical protein